MHERLCVLVALIFCSAVSSEAATSKHYTIRIERLSFYSPDILPIMLPLLSRPESQGYPQPSEHLFPELARNC